MECWYNKLINILQYSYDNISKHDNWRLEASTPTEISSKTSLLIKKHHWLRPICSSRNAQKVRSHIESCTSKDNINKIDEGEGTLQKGWDSARERVRSSLTLWSLRLVLILILRVNLRYPTSTIALGNFSVWRHHFFIRYEIIQYLINLNEISLFCKNEWKSGGAIRKVILALFHEFIFFVFSFFFCFSSVFG